MEQLGPIVFLALLFLGLFAYSKIQEMDEADEERKQRQALRKKRDSWTPPPFHGSNAAQAGTVASNRTSDSFLPSLSDAPKDTRTQLKEVYLCYLIWDKRIIGKSHPNLSEAHEYGFEWVEEHQEKTVGRLREFVSYQGDRLSGMWGTRHHRFALNVISLVDFGEVEQRLHVHAFSVLADQFALCRVDLSKFNEAQWDQFFGNPNEMIDLEEHLVPINLKFKNISSIRDYVCAAGPREELFDL